MLGVELERPVLFIMAAAQSHELIVLLRVKVAREAAAERPLFQMVIFVVDFDFVKVKFEGVVAVQNFVSEESRE